MYIWFTIIFLPLVHILCATPPNNLLFIKLVMLNWFICNFKKLTADWLRLDGKLDIRILKVFGLLNTSTNNVLSVVRKTLKFHVSSNFPGNSDELILHNEICMLKGYPWPTVMLFLALWPKNFHARCSNYMRYMYLFGQMQLVHYPLHFIHALLSN